MHISQKNKIFFTYKIPSHLINDNKNIGNKLEDFEILQILGKGSYGYVAKVKSKINFEIYALKKNIEKKMDELEYLKLKNELSFLRKFNHENVCKCLTYFEENGCSYIVMKLFNNKDLYRFLEANKKLDIRIKEDTLWDIFRQCLEGLLYIHKEGVIHRDIKPSNILMDDKGNIQIGDFGISSVMNLEQSFKYAIIPEQIELLLFKNENVGTKNYQAPEINSQNPHYDQKADVYSMGVSFFVLCYYDFPYSNGQRKVEEMIRDNNYSYELRNTIFKMIHIDPNRRSTSSDIYCYFKKNYIKLYAKNSGLYSLIKCLFSFPNFSYYFMDPIKMAFIMETKYPKKISLIMISLVSSLRDKKDIAENIYALRQILYEEGIKVKDNIEISPLKAINLILVSLNNELNTIDHSQYSKNNKNYFTNQSKQGDRIGKYKEFKESYQKNFKSFISDNFLGVLKIKRTCSNKNMKVILLIISIIFLLIVNF